MIICMMKQLNCLRQGQLISLSCPTYMQGYSFGDGQFDKNKKVLIEMIELSNQLNSKYIILHPEFGSVKNFIKLLGCINDDRFVVENMPRYGMNDTKELIAYNYSDIKKIIDECGLGFCLDLAHASKTAISLDRDYKAFIQKFFSLDPRIAHVSDGRLTNRIDEHLDLGSGDFDLNFFKSLLSSSRVEYLTFEVPKKNGLNNDIKNLNLMVFS
jgi:endonuclease IV